MGQRRGPIRLRLHCPKCGEPQWAEFDRRDPDIDFECDCGADFECLYARVRAKRSRRYVLHNVPQRSFDLRYYDAAGTQHHLEWSTPDVGDIEMRKGDDITIYMANGRPEFIENHTIREISRARVKTGCLVWLVAGGLLVCAASVLAGK